MAYDAYPNSTLPFLDDTNRDYGFEQKDLMRMLVHAKRVRSDEAKVRNPNLILTSFGPETFSRFLVDLLEEDKRTEENQHGAADTQKEHRNALYKLISNAVPVEAAKIDDQRQPPGSATVDRAVGLHTRSELGAETFPVLSDTVESMHRNTQDSDLEPNKERLQSFEKHASDKRRAGREDRWNEQFDKCALASNDEASEVERNMPDESASDWWSGTDILSRPVTDMDLTDLSQSSTSKSGSVSSGAEVRESLVDTSSRAQQHLGQRVVLHGDVEEDRRLLCMDGLGTIPLGTSGSRLDDEAEARSPFGDTLWSGRRPDSVADGINLVLQEVDYSEYLPSYVPLRITQASRRDTKTPSEDANDDCSLSTQMSLIKVDRLALSQANCVDDQSDDSGDVSFRTAIDVPTFMGSVSPTSRPVRSGFPSTFWDLIPRYLSSQEIRNLRLVNKKTARDLASYMFRSSVVKFGPAMFDIDHDSTDLARDACTKNSMFQRFGKCFNKFGISFEYDLPGLATAPPKVIDQQVSSWFGSYVWPKKDYPYFKYLREQENLVSDNSPLLKNSMSYLDNVSELALSLDSGHGWLNGADISDLALWDLRHNKGTKVFGKSFDAEDAKYAWALRQYFKWAQLNTLSVHKDLSSENSSSGLLDADLLSKIQVREYDDYLSQSRQPDMNPNSHTGGLSLRAGEPLNLPQIPQGFGGGGLAHAFTGLPTFPNLNGGHHPHMMLPPINLNHLPIQLGHPHTNPFIGRAENIQDADGSVDRRFIDSKSTTQQKDDQVHLQWPIIFNCFNTSSQAGGCHTHIAKRAAVPAELPLRPGKLTEAQAQWLMETLWAQRVFLSAYTNSVIANADVFKKVHSLHISKVSANMLPSLAQREFWSSLRGLRTITLLVIPDWRREHVLGDAGFNTNMLINPVDSSGKLAHILNDYITKLENLSSLTIGFVGGGEHATGMFARNNHVLPAPIVYDCGPWLTDHAEKPDAKDMITFNHVRTLKFQNCWFSPCMLKTFMHNSRDTSLHHLILDSVSLTGKHTARSDSHLTVEKHNLRCEHDAGNWLEEKIPVNACWVSVLDDITPGKTILMRKHDAHLIDEEDSPRPVLDFRGHIETISLVSCGYVSIGGANHNKFNQNGLVFQSRPDSAVDRALQNRQARFLYESDKRGVRDKSADPWDVVGERQQFFVSDTKPLKERKSAMMSAVDPSTRVEWLGLGRLTSCVHPVEKRVLEGAWGMRFGWGDSPERFRAVEDGCFEGGTGRFSGRIYKIKDEECLAE